MLRLLEPRRPQAERYAPCPEHALGNGRPRSVVLTGRRPAPTSMLDSGHVAERPGTAGSVRPPPGKRQSRPASGAPTRPVTAGAQQQRRRDRVPSGSARLMQDAIWTDTSQAAQDASTDAGVIERDDAAVPGLELSGVSPEDLDDAGILYEEERGLLGASAASALAAAQRSTHESEPRSTQHSDGGGDSRPALRTGSLAGAAGGGANQAATAAARPSVRVASGSGEATRPKRVTSSTATQPTQKVCRA